MRILRPTAAVLALAAATLFAAPAAAAPATPDRLHVTNVTATEISFRWVQNVAEGPVRARVYQDGVLVFTTRLLDYTATNLAPGRTYSFYLVAADDAGNTSAPTRTLTITTRGPGVVPAGPTDLRTTEVAPTRVSLAWKQPDDSFDVSVYELLDGAAVLSTVYASNWWGIPVITLPLRELVPGSAHAYSVRAIRPGLGASTPTNTVAVTTPARTDTSAPSTPAGFEAHRGGYACFSVRLIWQQSTDNADPQPALDYRVELNGAFYSWVRGTGNASIDTVPFGTSTITVRAVDSSGNVSAAATDTVFRPARCLDEQ